MTKPYEKPNHHRVLMETLREWRTKTRIDQLKSVCAYCDEDIVRTKNVTCSMSCGEFCVWIDTASLAKFNLEMHA
jgi:hypothetical protein